MGMKTVRYFIFVVLLSLPTFAQNVTFESYRKARVALPLKRSERSPHAQGAGTVFYAKSGLIVRNGKPFELIVPAKWRAIGSR